MYNENNLNSDASPKLNLKATKTSIEKAGSKHSIDVSKSTVNQDNESDNGGEVDLLDALNDFMDFDKDENQDSSEYGLDDSDSISSLDEDEKLLMRIKFADNIMSRYNQDITL